MRIGSREQGAGRRGEAARVAAARLAAALCLAVGLLAGAAGQAKPARRGPIRHVMVISVDGLMPETYLKADEHGLKIPTLREMMRHGAWSEGARSVFPTLTYPAHTSLATGTNPGTHGIISNETFDPLDENQRGWRWYAEDIRVPTLWDAAREKGLRTALVSWPVTVGARATAVVPEYWRAGTSEDVKLMKVLGTPGLLEAVAARSPKFWERYTPPETKNAALTDIATYLIEAQKPHLLLLHIYESDAAQHHHGPFSNEAKAALEDADAQIARVIESAKKAGIWKHTAVVVASDHGFVPFRQRLRVGVYLAQSGLVELDERGAVQSWKAAVLPMHGLAYIYLKDPNDEQSQQELRRVFEPMEGKPGSGIRHIYSREEVRELGGDPEAYMALAAQEGYDFTGGYTGDVFLPVGRSVAGHGYDPRVAGMQASLLVYGPGIEPGKIEGARLIDVAPTVAGWLGLKMEKAEGKALPVRIRKKPQTQSVD